jgi:hypothetical protein
MPNMQCATCPTGLEGEAREDVHRREVCVELARVEDKDPTSQRATSCPIDWVRHDNSSLVDR